LFFTYPTTGTATAGFAGYLADQHELLADLIHMRAVVDLEAIRDTPEDRTDAAARIDSLRAWDRKVVVCTVDTVLGLLQAQRRPVYSFPAFAVGAFVFDEVHSYNHKLFGGLLRFLQEFPGVPALIMSASIPPTRLARLQKLLGERAGEVIKGDADLEGHKRYRLETRTSDEVCWNDVAGALRVGKKVLWVCNTVGAAIRTAREAAKWTPVKPIVYHSRFRYRDRAGDKSRRGRQREVMDEFAYHTEGPLRGQRKKPGPSLVVTTQVCEMSLDISADLLVTAECPLPALVQRLGRLNRYATGDDPCPALVYPFKGLPYNEDPKSASLYGDYSVSMQATRDTVQKLAGQPCSQRDLSERLDQMHDQEEPDTSSMLFDGGWVTDPMPVRVGGDEGVTVIWGADLPEITAKFGPNRQKWPSGKLIPWTIPMDAARRKVIFNEYAGPYPVAGEDMLDYTIEEGGQWKRN
jgi:CRISPR-associated endonuclease/helicase Cas3